MQYQQQSNQDKKLSVNDVFGGNEEDSEEEDDAAGAGVPRHGNFSRNIGANTPQAVQPKTYRRTWNVENAKHQRLSRPISELFNDKIQKKRLLEEEAERERNK